MEDQPSSPLERLYQLQEVLNEVRTKTERRSKTPDHLVHVEAAYNDLVHRRQELGGRVQSAEARKKELASEVADLAEQLAKYQKQLALVKTNREYGALLNEIDEVKKKIRAHEDETLALEETLGKAQAEASQGESGFPAEEQGYLDQMKEWRAEQEVLGGEIAAASAKAEALRARIDKKLLLLFDRIAKTRQGLAVARVEMVGNQTAACSACHVRLRPQLLSDLRMSREAVHCESCKRILYWDPKAEV
ncbi:hypothetical protein FBQ97_01665 [Acidobacteria bacterium ACD]|nr:MAG: hypothetical protein EDX89_11835 [Acidobacteriota bacterium]MCE7957036.1 hypothetical protein [Acidobacteria bacterium ACB2]MDL1948509.1 hypothetical protein [Acidobacteria bacterium ACD]